MRIVSIFTATDFYDTLFYDIKKSFKYVTESVALVERICKKGSIEHRVAKAIAILQLVTEVGVNTENITALLQDRLDQEPKIEEIKNAILEIQKHKDISLNEIDGSYRFMSEAVNNLEKKKDEYKITQRDRNEELKKLLEISAAPTNKRTFFLLAIKPNDIENDLIEIIQCNKIYSEYISKEKDKELIDYLNSQKQRADRLGANIERTIHTALGNGVILFKRISDFVVQYSSDKNIVYALNKILQSKGTEIFDKYHEASVSADAKLAEKFLLTEKLDRISRTNDPLNLVNITAGSAKIKSDAPCIVSIKDYLSNSGRLEGRQLLEHFSHSPYGWSPDTIRYILSAMLL